MARERHGDGDGGTELGRFLYALRTRVAPAALGLPAGVGVRRTPGLRREELATLAGISVDYYARLERGTESRPSPSVIDSIARAIHLSEIEHKHLRDLAACADGQSTTPAPIPSRSVPPGIDLLLEAMRPNPAHLVDRACHLLAANPGGLHLFAGIEKWPADQRNFARYLFLHPSARDLIGDWETEVRTCVAWLRAQAGIEPDAPDLSDLVSELLHESPDFARMWDRYDIAGNAYGHKTYRHPVIGDISLGYHSMTLNGLNGLYLITYYAEPGTPDHTTMVRLDQIADDSMSQTPP